MAKETKKEREYPSLSILCGMFEAAKDPEGLARFFGAVGTVQAEAYSRACADLGDRIHKALEGYELGHDSDTEGSFGLTDDRERYMFALVVKWLRETKAKALAIEDKLDSDLLHFSCRVDRVYTFGAADTQWVVDFKTSASMKDSYKMQLAGYSLGWFEKTGKWVDQGAIVRVEKSPRKKCQLEIIQVHELWRWLEPLALLRKLWDFQHNRGEHDDRKTSTVGLLS